jgi:hypothetical protein
MNNQGRLIAFVLMTCTSASLACSRPRILEQSPSDVVREAYLAANEGKYSQAEKHLSSDVVNAMKGHLGAMTGGMKGAWDRLTKGGTIEQMEILKEEIRGEGARVHFRLRYKDGATKEDDEPLIRENGRWKISP